MSIEKQIENMASIIHSKVNGANFDDVSDAVVALYTAGYRKASDVAREIFEEIEEEITAALKSYYKVLPQLEFSNELYNRVQGKVDALRGVEGFVAELKKKYTEGGK